MRGESALSSLLCCIEVSISERERKQFEEGLNVQKVWESKRYLFALGW